MVKNEDVNDIGGQDLHTTAAGNVSTGIKTEKMTAEMDGVVNVANPSCGFEAMEEEDCHQGGVGMETIGDKDLWLDVNDASIFYNDFPPLPDFPCMSSSSSSSSVPLVAKPIAATSSSSSPGSSSPATSWAVMKSDADQEDTSQRVFQQFQGSDDQHQVKVEAAPAALSSTASMEIQLPSDHDRLGDVDCIDVMENFGYMDLIDSNEIWDPSSVFQTDNPQELLDNDQHAAAAATVIEQEDQKMPCQGENENENDGGFSFLHGNSELAAIFFEWLKQNKDYISAEDMRSIKLKRSTIESASKRLGSTKEGKKQLLKLILEWVEQFQLQKKRTTVPQSPFPCQDTVQIPDFNPTPNPNSYLNFIPAYPDPNTCFSTSPWMPPPLQTQVPETTATMVAAPPHFPSPVEGYSCGDPYTNHNILHVTPLNHQQVVNGIPYPPSAEYSMMDHAQSWTPSPFIVPPAAPSQFNPFPDNNANIFPRQPAVYGNPYQVFDQNGERLMRLGSSATKEARKKRMARQRRLYAHHSRHNSSSNSTHNHNQDQMNDHHVVGDDCDNGGQDSPPGNNWVYWSSGSSSSPSMVGMIPPVDASQPHSGDRISIQHQNYQRQTSTDRRPQGWKTEKNLKFLLQKVLKQSDVGNLGRIVLPKKEAESHLPELESRDGIPIAMEDIGTSRVWNMRYRFWPNNKSRMYLLENTGDFVRVNGLQEGDFIVIYSDTKCGKYMIRGVKVRQPGTKLEGKKPIARRNVRNLPNNSSLAPIKQAVR